MESLINRYSDGTPFVPNWVLQTKGMQAIAEKLAKYEEYEDLEEQGLLLKLPCKVGDKVYHVIVDHIANPPVYISEHKIQDVSAKSVYWADDWWPVQEMSRINAFFTKKEAERKVRELQEKENVN